MEDISIQESEILLLKSMFDSNELIFFEQNNSINSDNFCSFEYKMKLLESKLAIVNISLSLNYPLESKPEVNFDCNFIDNKKLNHELKKFVEKQQLGVPLVLDIINWINENYNKYIINTTEETSLIQNPVINSHNKSDIVYARFWIYSHHIYSSTKRRKILSNANQLDLRGFCVPGKPGLIVVEGTVKDCNSFYAEIRSWNWQKLQLKIKETSEDNKVKQNNKEEFFRLPNFCELMLSVSSNKNGNDLQTYLKSLNFESYFRQIFLTK